MNRKVARLTALATALIIALALAATASAQVFTGRIDGTVEDATGGRLPGVTVDLTGPVNQTQVTDAQGLVHFLNLPVGTYTVTATLASFNPYKNENVVVAAGASTPLSLRMTVAGQATTVEVTAAAPIVDQRRQSQTTNVTNEEMQNIPTARDPWVVMQTVPSIAVDRVNVGGSESGQQSVYLAKGATQTDNTWSIDGVPITDMGATGSSPTYFDFDMFQEMAVTTGGADASNPTPGVQLNMVLKKGSNTPHGNARYYFENESLQGNNITAAEAASLGSTTGKGNRTAKYEDYGVEVGGPLVKDRLWGWGTIGKTHVDNLTLVNQHDKTDLKNYGAKVDGQVNSNIRGNFTFFEGNKEKFGRSVGPTRATETGWNQTGPTKYYKGEGDFVVGQNLFITARGAYITGGFHLAPVGGMNTYAYLDDAGTYHGSYLDYLTDRPQKYFGGDASYFVGKQEIKFGLSYRDTPVDSNSTWPGTDMIVTYWTGYPTADAQVTQPFIQNTEGKYFNGFVTDTLSLDRLTVIGGIRFDHQASSLTTANVPAVPGFTSILPAITVPAVNNAYDWNSVTPRVGITYALNESKKSILRASYAMFASQLPANAGAFVSPAQYTYAYYTGCTDTNRNGILDPSEIAVCGAPDITGGPGENANFVNMKAPLTNEFLVGVDHEVAANFGLSATFTYRHFSRLPWDQPVGVTAANYTQTGSFTVPAGKDPVSGVTVPIYTTTVSNNGVWEATNRPDYHQTYMGFELAATKRMSNRWMGRLGFSSNSWKEYFDNRATSIINPTRGPFDNTGGLGSVPVPYQSGPLVDGGTIAIRSTGSGNKGNVYITPAQYQLTANGMYQAPYGLDFGANYILRQGYVMPYFRDRVGQGMASSYRLLLTNTVDQFRMDSISSLDGRVEWRPTALINMSRYTFAIDFDVFNLLNNNTVLQRQLNARVSTFNQPVEIMNPRIARLGVRFTF